MSKVACFLVIISICCVVGYVGAMYKEKRIIPIEITPLLKKPLLYQDLLDDLVKYDIQTDTSQPKLNLYPSLESQSNLHPKSVAMPNPLFAYHRNLAREIRKKEWQVSQGEWNLAFSIVSGAMGWGPVLCCMDLAD